MDKQINKRLSVSKCGHMLEICIDQEVGSYYASDLSELLTRDEVIELKKSIDLYLDYNSSD